MNKRFKLIAETSILLMLFSLICVAQSEEQTCAWRESADLLRDGKDKPVILKNDELESRLLGGKKPKYPSGCRCQGAVPIFLHIDAKGEVVCHQFLSGHPLFKASISAVIKSWRFAPYQTSDGMKSFAAIVTYNFNLESKSWGFGVLETLPCTSPKAVLKDSSGQALWLQSDEMMERAIEKPEPRRDAHFKGSGYVLVNVLVNENGKTVCAAPVNGHPILRASAMETVTKWKFKPFLVDNNPIPFLGHIVFSFPLGIAAR